MKLNHIVVRIANNEELGPFKFDPFSDGNTQFLYSRPMQTLRR